MEYCSGQLIDYLNARIHSRLDQEEILSIFLQIVQGVAVLHSKSPCIIHRDLKIENVLISSQNVYKLCDFGSATTQIIPPGHPNSIQEIRALEEDISKYTTLQYRAPELIDLYQKRGLDSKMGIYCEI
jgi:serine/threonine protein kinase